ncbi:hypothetical protein [Robertmurraya sp. Marseille-Q9965]
MKNTKLFFIGRFWPEGEVENQTSSAGLPSFVGAVQVACAFVLCLQLEEKGIC